MRKQVLLLLLFLLTLPILVNGQKVKESFRLGKYKFELIEEDSKCILSYTTRGRTKRLTLEVIPPCELETTYCGVKCKEKIIVKHYRYKDIGASVFIISGNAREGGCKAQGVLVKKNRVVLGKTTSGRIGRVEEGGCGNYEEKDFWLLSH
ncbi:MAG: hypothetical protein D6687_04855 [Acidobacteria bacterium]|jgi:hypothetical protein|nr:MAG: hypothetical protein D6687_04855 [Acidobacteriota bacterium]GIU82877.1 MAG: hypothetical protein KatS3mg006_1941 [Pyrinomonadaceae bacterium]